ncbi:MAG: hypothetical protein JW983_10290 [Elusimicrobia bacterium]|nr:hypothetical protein [Elusimicrobiota bacterium]
MDKLNKVDVLKEVTDGIAHKIRNPLGIMSTAVQFCIAHPEKKDKVRNHLENIRKCIKDIENTLKYIGNFCRPLQLNLKPLPVKKLLDNLYFAVEDRCRLQEIRLIEKYRNISYRIMFDQDYLEEAFLNFIINSLEAMPDGGSLTLESDIDSNKKEIIVKFIDTGTGILDRHIDEIFAPFFTTKANQLGLGLCIAQRIINVHKGRIEVNSGMGKGTMVSVYLPMLNPGDKDV